MRNCFEKVCRGLFTLLALWAWGSVGSAFADTSSAPTSTDSVLLWMIEDPLSSPLIQPLNGGSNIHVTDLSKDGLTADYARVRIAGTDNYLNLWYSDNGSLVLDTANPVTAAEITKDASTGNWVAPTYAQVGSVDPATQFMIELGNYDAKDNWIVMAMSDATSYSTLYGTGSNGHIFPGELGIPEHLAWTGGHFYEAGGVPEPTSGVLVLLGGALLALRRRRRNV